MVRYPRRRMTLVDSGQRLLDRYQRTTEASRWKLLVGKRSSSEVDTYSSLRVWYFGRYNEPVSLHCTACRSAYTDFHTLPRRVANTPWSASTEVSTVALRKTRRPFSIVG